MILLTAGSSSIEFLPSLTSVSSLSSTAGWGQRIQFDGGMTLTGFTTPTSSLNDATLSSLGPAFVIGQFAVVEAANLFSFAFGQPMVTKIDGKLDVLGKDGGNTVETDFAELSSTGRLTVSTIDQAGDAKYKVRFGMSANDGQIVAKGTQENSAELDIYTLVFAGGDLQLQNAKCFVSGTLTSNDANCPNPSMIVKSEAV